MSMCRIEGNTWPVRRELYALGARWNAQEKSWYISEDKLKEANALVARVPPQKHKPFHVKCPVCGSSFDANAQKRPTEGRPQRSDESETNPFNE